MSILSVKVLPFRISPTYHKRAAELLIIIFSTLLSLVWFILGLVSPVYAMNDPAQISDIVGVLAKIIGLLAPAAAIAVFIMILVAGFQFLTSGGDPKAVATARTTLTYAIIGVILVVVVWLILTLIKAVTDVDVTTVNLPIP